MRKVDVARMLRRVVALFLVVVAAASARAADFSVPPALRPPVDFWIGVFAVHSKHQMVIHDPEDLSRIYSVLDLRDLAAAGYSDDRIGAIMRERETAEKARLRDLLLALDRADPRAPLGPEAQRLRALFAADRSPSKYRDAAAPERLRGQRGLRERFAYGLSHARGYFPEMERLFRAAGVPAEITRLTMVESTFNLKAYSKVGAAGVWQFMPATGRSFMRVDGVVDERLDPLIATHAAARFLRQNFDRLGSWPLAIKAYNHGPGGMSRAVRETGSTDIVTIIGTYRGPAFRFASRNFYPSFLAALHVERNAHKYFGDLKTHPMPRSERVVLDRPAALSAAARCAGTDPWALAELNPSLLSPVKSGRAKVPAGFALRVPPDRGARLRRCLQSLPPTVAARRAAPPARARVVHRVRAGQTLSGIAARYGCSIKQIRRTNRLRGSLVRTGQLLRIPRC